MKIYRLKIALVEFEQGHDYKDQGREVSSMLASLADADEDAARWAYQAAQRATGGIADAYDHLARRGTSLNAPHHD